MRVIIFSLAILLASAVFIEAAPISSVVAVINGDMITSRELDKVVEPELIRAGIDGKNPANAATVEQVRRQVLDSMITEKLMTQEADRLGVVVQDEMVEQELTMMVEQSQLSQEEFLRQMAAQGLTLDDFKAKIRSNITTQRLINQQVMNKVVVTDSEIQEYYKVYGTQMPSGQARIGLIVYPAEENAANWAGRITSGQTTFEDVARQVSVGPNPQGGGDLGFINIEDMAPVLQEVVSTLQPGQVSGLLDMQLNKSQVKLYELAAGDSGAQDAPLTPEAAARIEEVLRRPRLETRLEEYIAGLRNKALIEIRL